MILDEQSIERGALGALELLDGDERERLERDLRLNPELAECSADFRDVVADVALAGCQKLETPPLSALTGALERIGAVDSQPERKRFSGWRHSWPAVGACAALLLLVGGGVTAILNHVSVDDNTTATVAPDLSGDGGDKVVIMRDGKTLATMKPGDRALKDLLEQLGRMERLRPAPDVIQDIARLKRELKSLRRVDAERFSAGPRVARTVYIEMVEPGSDVEEETTLSERVGDYIATAIEIDVGVTEAGTGNSTQPEDPLVKEPIIFDPEISGVVPELDSADEDTPFYYPDFPIGHDHFERIDDSRAWDRDNQRIWIETDQPGLFQAFVPPAGFDPDFIEDFDGQIPMGGTLPAPVVADEPVLVPIEEPLPEPELIDLPVEEPEPLPVVPVAVTIYEETTGQGSVVIGNLAPAEEGLAYQLWMRNAADDQVVSVGMLPEMENGSERFDFDLLGPGITPSGFFVTLEPEGGVESPSENVILQGP